MSAENRYRPRHATLRFHPVLAIATLFLGMFAHGASALEAASPPAAGLGRGFGRLG
ncbi:MAG: hypothetical protein H0T94_12525 [Acidimicrobiia bacterium]|nr:hypothetical protein [Acidimicrobiia bacterium]MDQ3500088.1 hypothetical protein [Actinomycetota bacterium]